MTTAHRIITDAAAEIGVIASGQTLEAEDAQLMLRHLNRRLQTWSNSRLMVPVLTEVSVTLTGLQSYTIGPTGAVVTARPIRVESATATDAGGVAYPVEILNSDQWHGISVKDVTGGPPSWVWYSAQNTNGAIYVYPKASGYTLKLQCLSLLSSFAGLLTDCVLPDGYEMALVLTLAEDSAGSFGKPIPPDLRMRARGARAAVKRTNTEPLLLTLDAVQQPFQIERGF